MVTPANTRRIAVDLLHQIEVDHVQAKGAIEDAATRHQLSPQDRGFLKELVQGVIRRLNTVDWVATSFLLQRRWEEVPPPIQQTLRIGVYQLLYMRDRVPDYAAVNETTELSKELGHQGIVSFVNATLRSVQEHRDGITFPDEKQDLIKHISLTQSHPEWLVTRWITRFGPKVTKEICEFDNQPAPLCLRVNTLKSTRDAVMAALTAAGIPHHPGMVPEAVWLDDSPELELLAPFQDGWCTVQDEAAQIMTHLLSPRPGEAVLDACAAPGGKTTHMAALMQNQGRILALDDFDLRIKLIHDNCRRLGVKNAEIMVLDARKAGQEFPRAFDRALVDAPCSGTGILRRHVDLRWRKSARDVTSTLPALQQTILASVSQTVKPRGILVYSTCSIEPEENERVVHKFLHDHPLYEIQEPPPTMPPKTGKFVDGEGFIRILPHQDGMDGFFAARMRRIS